MPVFSNADDPRASSALSQYLAEIARHPLLTRDDESALARRIRAGDHDALDALVRANLRFVVMVAKRYRDQGLALEDLINEGNLGLLRAAERFDETKGVKFISYAVWWIRQAMLQALAEQGRMVRVPMNRALQAHQLARRVEALQQELGRAATQAELAEALEMDPEEVASLLSVVQAPVSLDAPRADGSDARPLGEYLADDHDADPDDQLSRVELTEAVRAALESLPARQALVLRLYFGFDGATPLTLDEIGARLPVSRS